MAAATLGALARIARREVLHHRRHSLLLVAMIALPVAGLVAGTALLDTLGQPTGSVWIEMFGSLVVVVFWTVSAITLVAAVLMAGAAVTIAARRQLRALGLLAAAGARGRQLGAVMVLQAATLGLVGALAGIPAGLLLARALLPRLAQAIHLPLSEPGPSLLVVPGRLLLAAGLGLLAAVIAALVPAIRAARQPVTQALAAQQPPARYPRRRTMVGIVLVLVGLGLVVLQVWLAGSRWQPWIAVASVAAVLVGFAALSCALVAVIGRIARRLPATGRLAVRDLARHPTRSAAAVTAVTAGLAVPMLLGVMDAQSAAYERDYGPHELRSDQVLADSPATAADVTKLLPGARQAPFTTARDAAGNQVMVHGPVIDQDSGANRGLAIGEHELLVAMGGEQAAAAFAGGAVVVFGTNLVPDGQVTLAITDIQGPARRITVPAVEVTSGSYMGDPLPSFVISRQTAQRLGLPGPTTPPQYLVRAPRPLSDAQRDQLRGLQTRTSAFSISWAEPDPTLHYYEQGSRSILLALLAAAGIIALGSVAAACALALSEARQDLITLGQLGAAPAMTRRLMAAQAWLLATLGGLLAAAIALGPAAVQALASWQVHPRLGIPIGPMPWAVPWTLLAVVTLAIPALAAAAASLLGRSPAPLTPQRGG
jgi:putative ABC transport system permease protein